MPSRTELARYTPLSDAMLDPQWWRKRFAAVVLLSGLLGGALSTLGAQILWPRDRLAAVAKRQAAMEDSIRRHGKLIDSVNTKLGQNIYVACATLKLVQPKGAVLPQACNQ